MKTKRGGILSNINNNNNNNNKDSILSTLTGHVSTITNKTNNLIGTAGDKLAVQVNRLSKAFGKEVKHSGWYPDWINRLYTNEITVRPTIQYKNSMLNLKDISKQVICKNQKIYQVLLILIIPRTSKLNSFLGFFLSNSRSQI